MCLPPDSGLRLTRERRRGSRPNRQGQVRGQRPWCSGPYQGAYGLPGRPQFLSRAPGARANKLEGNGDRRVLAGPVGIVLADLEVGKRRFTFPAVREYPITLVQQAFLVKLRERPHDALHVGEVHCLVIVGEIDPAGLAGDVALPFTRVTKHRGPAILVEPANAVAFDVDSRRQLELFHRLHLGRQAMAIPTEPPLHPPTSHRFIARDGILHVPRQEMPVVGQPIGKRRPIVKHIFLGPAARLDGGFERPVVSPIRQDLALYFGEVGFVRDARVGHPAIRGRAACHITMLWDGAQSCFRQWRETGGRSAGHAPEGPLRRPGLLSTPFAPYRAWSVRAC